VVNAEVNALTKLAETEIVEANATLQATIRREQRRDITRSRALVMSLLAELEHQTENAGLYERLAELLYDKDADGDSAKDQAKRIEAFQKALSLGGRVGTMKQLADALKVMVALEREAFGIDERRAADNTTTFNMQF